MATKLEKMARTLNDNFPEALPSGGCEYITVELTRREVARSQLTGVSDVE